jgi:hypothetical protein
MAEELHSEFTLLDQAVESRDAAVVAKWRAQYDAWVNGDHDGICPFETVDAFKRTSTLSSPFNDGCSPDYPRFDLGQAEDVPRCRRCSSQGNTESWIYRQGLLVSDT